MARAQYTAALKTRDGIRALWKLVLLGGVIFSFHSAWEAGNLSLCLGLAHRVHSLDDTCDKIAQSLPKAIRIFNAMQKNGGLLSNLSAACAGVGKIAPLPLREIWGSGSKGLYSATYGLRRQRMKSGDEEVGSVICEV